MEVTSKNLKELIQAQLDRRIDDESFDALEEYLTQNPEARELYVEMARLDAGLSESAVVSGMVAFPDSGEMVSKPAFSWIKLAAVLAILALGAGFLMRSLSEPSGDAETNLVAMKGVAVITAEAGAVWGGDDKTLETGIALEPGHLVLEKGLAQIDFFGGASVSLSAPVEIELLDRDSAILHRGTLKADVPPAARGFEIHTGDVLLEDLGTSFGISVDEENRADLIVFDGEVRATGKDGQPMLLSGGDSAKLTRGEAKRQSAESVGSFPDIVDVIAGSGNREEVRYATWKESSLDRRRDLRLIAYYDFENLTSASRRLRNQALHGEGSELDGGIVGARVAEGRWGNKTALDFRSEGDRVRFDIPGEFSAITLYAWVRIDALDRHLNSLFLTDYFDENEFHWQISRKGALHFATSPKGVVDIPKHNRRFYSDCFWNPGMSGQWHLLATTAGGAGGEVAHYIDGELIGFSGGTNMEKPLPEKMRIGEADLGNWSDPIWPDAGIRTLNGRIDEFAIYDAVLSPEEIREIYESGKP